MKDLIKDFATPFKDAFVSRLASPLTMGFLISWIVYNYKLILILWSDNRVSTIFDLISKHVFRDPFASIWSFVVPMLCSLAYLFIYDPIASWIHVMKLERDTKLENKKKEASGKKVLSAEEYEEILLANKRMEDDFSILLAEANKKAGDALLELETMKRLLKSANEKIEHLQRPTFDSKVLEDEHLAILGKMLSGKVASDYIKLSMPSHSAVIEQRVRELIQHNLVSRTVEPDGSVYYGLSQLGRNVLARDGL